MPSVSVFQMSRCDRHGGGDPEVGHPAVNVTVTVTFTVRIMIITVTVTVTVTHRLGKVGRCARERC